MWCNGGVWWWLVVGDGSWWLVSMDIGRVEVMVMVAVAMMVAVVVVIPICTRSLSINNH